MTPNKTVNLHQTRNVLSCIHRPIAVFMFVLAALFCEASRWAEAGVILDGDSQDLSFVTKVAYIESRNAFVLNDDVVYLNPVSHDDFKELDEALGKDDRLGVSIGGDQSTVFGALPPVGNISRKLKAADRFLVAIALNNLEYIPGYKYPAGYKPRAGQGRIVVLFKFHDFRFTKSSEGELKRSSSKISSTIVPLSMEKRGNGFLPDQDRIARGEIDSGYLQNVKHIDDNIDYYAREKAVRVALAYGEAAAFIRSIRSKGIKLDLN